VGKPPSHAAIQSHIANLRPDLIIDVLDDSTTLRKGESKSDAYRDGMREKMTLGSLRSSVERRLGRNTVLLFDSMNLIKGFRYEIWALARQVGTKCCVVSVETGAATCKEWNARRADDQRYEEEVMEDLVERLERPDSIRRWESPLFSLYPDRQSEDEIRRVCEEVARYCCGLQNSRAPNGDPDDEGGRTSCSSGEPFKQQKVGNLTPAMATAAKTLAPTNLLHAIDKEVQSAIKEIVAAQTLSGGAPPGVIRFDGGSDMPILNATRHLTPAELRRWKRMFVKMITNTTFQEKRPEQVKALFIQYVSEQIHCSGI
jgi:protein KTI12